MRVARLCPFPPPSSSGRRIAAANKLLLALSQAADVADGVHSWRDDVAANACILRPQEMIWNALEDMRVQIVGKKRSATPLFGRRASPKERWDPMGVVQDRARRLGRASAPDHGEATELLKALDVAEASIGLLVQKRLAIPLGTGDSEDAIGMALGGATHHLRSAVVLIRLGRIQAGFVLLRAACECIDACFFFRSKPAQAANWLQGKMPVVEPAASRKERAKDHGGHARPQTRALADALYQVQSAYVHPSFAALLPNYYSVQGREGIAFEALDLVDHEQSRKAVVALLGSIFWAWQTLAEVFPGEMTIAAERQAAQGHYRATASKLGLPDPLSGV